jgi:hypothetical protein
MTLTTLLISELVAVPLLFLSGSLFHFIYKWSRYNQRVALFGAVNESLWEHIKIAFWPTLLWTLIQYIFMNDVLPDTFLLAKTTSLLVIVIGMPLLVTLYTSITKHYIFPIDLTVFLLVLFIAQSSSLLILTSTVPKWVNSVSVLPLLLLIVMFLTFTIRPPKHPLFQDPTNDKYGESATRKRRGKVEFITPIK